MEQLFHSDTDSVPRPNGLMGAHEDVQQPSHVRHVQVSNKMTPYQITRTSHKQALSARSLKRLLDVERIAPMLIDKGEKEQIQHVSSVLSDQPCEGRPYCSARSVDVPSRGRSTPGRRMPVFSFHQIKCVPFTSARLCLHHSETPSANASNVMRRVVVVDLNEIH